MTALHLTDVQLTHLATLDPADLSPAERRFADEVADWRARDGGYMAEQGTKPDTLSVALGDSPAGLAAWILEKLRSWSDCGGDVERVFPRDELLTWITIWWVTGAIGTSFAPYAFREPPAPDRVHVPTVFSRFPADLCTRPGSSPSASTTCGLGRAARRRSLRRVGAAGGLRPGAAAGDRGRAPLTRPSPPRLPHGLPLVATSRGRRSHHEWQLPAIG